MPRKLKVFRTPIGFHDAYVAAPSRKAALAAWGSEADLFARGNAEEITDGRLMAEPLARPGEVIRVSRGDLAAQLKALGPRKKAATRKTARPEPETEPKVRARKPEAPPRRDKVDRAEAALEDVRKRHARERAALEKEVELVRRKLRAIEARQARDSSRLEGRLEKARADYRAALDKWSG
jgi:hypothetical protein